RTTNEQRRTTNERSAVAEPHQPAETDQRTDEISETSNAVAKTLAVRLLGHHAQHNRSEERKQQRCLEVRHVHGWAHYSFFLVAISNASIIARMFNRPAPTRNFVP